MAEIDVDELASLCLERLQSEGEQALDEICDAHPEHAVRIRGMVQQLQKIGLVKEPVSEISENFGDYRILERIGGGGMGVVYLAEQKSLGRRVALKLIRSGVLARGKARERFAREIEAISKLDHPGICTVYEAGEVERVPYLAMRYIEGESLASVLAGRRERAEGSGTTGGSQEILEDLHLIEKVARALHVAHEAGLLHRDVKPANIMIHQEGEPVILDFGLARLEDGVDQGLTASGEQLGTPAYMAPEQVQSGAVDRRTDVYGLGVTLYESLTLHPPFESGSRESLYREILSDEPPDPRHHNHSIGNELKIVLARALDKDPAERFATALDFAEELRRIRVHEPILSKRPGLVLRARRWSQRNRMATAVLATAILGLLVSLYFLREKTRAQDRLQALSKLMGANEVARDHPELAFKYAREVLNQFRSNLAVARVQEILWRLRERRELADPGLGSFHRVQISSDQRYALVLGLTQNGPSCLIDVKSMERWELPASHGTEFTEDGRWLVLGTLTGEVRIYALRDLQRSTPTTVWPATRILSLPSGEVKGQVTSISIDRREGELRILASYSHSPPRIWSFDGGPSVVLPVEKPFHYWSAGFLSEGRILTQGAIWSADGQKLLNSLAKSFEPLMHKSEPGEVVSPSTVHKISVTGDGRFLALSERGRLRIFDPQGDLTAALDSKSEADLIMHAKFSTSGRKILVTTAKGGVMILDREGHDLASWYLESGKTVVAAAFLAGEKRVVTGDWGGKITLWTADGQMVDRWAAHQGGIMGIAVLQDGKGMASVGMHSARLWPLRPMQGVPLQTLSGTLGMALSADRSRMLVVSSHGLVRLSQSDGTLLKQQVLPADLFWVGMDPDGKKAVVGGPQSFYQVEGLASKGEMKIRRMKARLRGIPQVLQNGSLVSPHPGGRILTWNPGGSSWNRITFANVVSRSVDGTMYFTASYASKIEAWTQDGQPLGWVFPTIPTPVSLSISPEMDRLLVGSMDGTAYLIGLATRDKIREFPGHEGGMRSSSFSPSGKRIATTGTDGTIRVWNVDSGAMLLVLRGHKRTVAVVEFLSETRLVSAGSDETLRWWSLDTKGLREVVERVPVPPMTEEEKRRYENLVK